MKDNKVFCNRCAHCHKDDTEEVIKINLHKLFIIKNNNKDNNINDTINLGNAFKDSNTPKYQVGMYNKIGNNTTIAAGSAVVRRTKDGYTYIGVPASALVIKK